jgi:hypothetical protein
MFKEVCIWGASIAHGDLAGMVLAVSLEVLRWLTH